MTLKPKDRATVRRFLVEHFSLNELKDLVFDLGLSYESFPHDTLESLARELIACFERTENIGYLLSEILGQRPDDTLARLLAQVPQTTRQTVQIIKSFSLMERTGYTICRPF